MIIMASLAQVAPAPTFAEFKRLAPSIAGDLVLQGQTHGRIDSIIAPVGGLTAPGVVEAELVEQPVATEQGCVRKRWTVSFSAPPNADIDTATLDHSHSATEIGMPGTHGCRTASYAHLNPGIDRALGFRSLTALERIRLGARNLRFQCSDETSSGLCRDDRSILRVLNTLTPWAISRDANDVLIWLGTPGGIVTEVRFDLAEPSRVRVTRHIPAPF